jgi:hypothetical protein
MLGYLAKVTYPGKLGFAVTQQAFADTAVNAVSKLSSFSGVVNVYHAHQDGQGVISHDGFHLVHSFAQFYEVVDFVNRSEV